MEGSGNPCKPFLGWDLQHCLSSLLCCCPKRENTFLPVPFAEQHIHSRSGKSVTNNSVGGAPWPHAWCFITALTFAPLLQAQAPRGWWGHTLWGSAGQATMGLMAQPARGHGAAEMDLTCLGGLLNWGLLQEERPLPQLGYPWTRMRDHRELPQLYVLQPTCLPLRGDTTILQVTSRDGARSSALAQLGSGTECHSHPTIPPRLDKKGRFFVVSLCVLCQKPYITLLHIQTLMLRVVERSSGNDTRAGGEEASPNNAAHNMVLIIQLPLISLSPSLSHTCTKRLIFGLKKKKTSGVI